MSLPTAKLAASPFAVLAALIFVSAATAGVQPTQVPIPWSELGARASADYRGDGMSVSATETGAALRCAFQRLEGEVTREGLWLVSTEESSDRFRVLASAIGRAPRMLRMLARTGTVVADDAVARFVRTGLVEEYSTSIDGLRQDFVVSERPAGGGSLWLELEVTGARAEPANDGARLVLDGSGREIAYGRLRVTDARDRILDARIEVHSATRLRVVVDDENAAYPVRIDPTFSDADWVSMGADPGTNGGVLAMAVDGSGNLYVGGSFTIAGDLITSNIAKWNGSTWSTLGSGLNNAPRALVVSGGDLYAGGSFTTAGGNPAAGIAKWNGTTWSALGSGVSLGNVNALAVTATDLYVGGSFTTAGGVAGRNRIAKWVLGGINDASWSALGSGLGADVAALAVTATDLYVGGSFTTAGGVAGRNRIAKWVLGGINDASWSALGSGVGDAQVSALAVSGTGLFVGGSFTMAGGAAGRNFIARWALGGVGDPSWTALGLGLGNHDVVGVAAIAASGTDIYVAGDFQLAGGAPALSVAKWNGSAWSALGSGVNSLVWSLAVSGTDLYIGGSFFAISGAAHDIARWNGSTLLPLGQFLFGLQGSVSALAVSGTDLYAGGIFTTPGGTSVGNIARWNGSAWSALGSGVNGNVFALAVTGTDLYVGGSFTAAGGVAGRNSIAKWTLGGGSDASWSALGSGVNNPVFALAIAGSDLYVGGSFTTAGGVAGRNRVAKWALGGSNDASWSGLGSGTSAQVSALITTPTELYVGGSFTTAGGVAGRNRIARWVLGGINDASWSGLGSGVGSTVNALAVNATDLYVGGLFTTAGGTPGRNRIAKWVLGGSTDASWSALGSGATSGQVNALALTSTDLYVGGIFTATGTPANNVAKWTLGGSSDASWSALGSGTNGQVFALAVNGIEVYAGGGFSIAGNKVSQAAATALRLEDFARIRSITDVGNDQGRWVRVRFARSGFDNATQAVTPVTGYQIYHRVDGALLSGPHAERSADVVVGTEAGTFPPGTWEAVASVNATQSNSYTTMVPTTADSTDSGIAWSVYLVTAHTTTPSVWFASPTDSGYSVDNLAPNVPTSLVVSYEGGVGNHLAWDPSTAADFRYFKVYRSTTPGFIPGPTNLVHSTTATTWVDAGFGGGTVYYKLTALDFAGNESTPASASITVGVDGARLPERFALHATTNPVRHAVSFAYDVPAAGGEIELALYDVGGRRMRTLVSGSQTPGQRSVTWDTRDDGGRSIPPGMYLVRMRAPGFTQVQKLVLAR